MALLSPNCFVEVGLVREVGVVGLEGLDRLHCRLAHLTSLAKWRRTKEQEQNPAGS